MKVISINGSPRGKNSSTQVMLDALLKGLKTPDTEIETVFLSEKNIGYCKGCYTCWTKTPGKCVMEDDMKDVIRLMENSNIILLGSPLYFNNISGTLKVFIDRLTSTGGDPHKAAKLQGSSPVPGLIMVSSCGFPYKSQFEVISLWVKKLAGLMQLRLIGEFYTANGKALTAPEKEQETSRENYLSFLESCGRQYHENFSLTGKQTDKLTLNITDF